MPLSTKTKKELIKRLNTIGFKKNKMVYTREINKEVFAIIAPTTRFSRNQKTKTDYYCLGLDIGVSYLSVDKLYQILTGSDTLYYESVVHKQIGYLMPFKQYKEWVFYEEGDECAVFDDMFKSIQEYAFPYYQQMSDLNNVFEIMVLGTGVTHFSRDRFLPILYYLRGDKQSGLKIIDEAIERQLHPKQPEVPHIEGATVELFVGPSYGKVDPAYLTFVENYRNLPEPNHNNSLA